jgi:hypothetical protein
MQTNAHFWSYLAQSFLEWEMFLTKVVEETKTYKLRFFENRAIYDNVEKYCTARQSTDNNMVHVHCILDTSVYKYMIRILILHYNSGCTNAPLPVLLHYHLIHVMM